MCKSEASKLDLEPSYHSKLALILENINPRKKFTTEKRFSKVDAPKTIPDETESLESPHAGSTSNVS